MVIAFKILVIFSGALLFYLNLVKIAKKEMDIGIGSWWAITALLVFLFGIVFNFTPLLKMVRMRNLIMIYLLCAAIMMTLYLYGLYVSKLKKQTDEFTQWISYAKSIREEQEKEMEESEVQAKTGSPH